jgi:hypothetical protein
MAAWKIEWSIDNVIPPGTSSWRQIVGAASTNAIRNRNTVFFGFRRSGIATSPD